MVDGRSHQERISLNNNIFWFRPFYRFQIRALLIYLCFKNEDYKLTIVFFLYSFYFFARIMFV